MDPRILDAKGREIRVGDRVERLKLLTPGWVETRVGRIGRRAGQGCPKVRTGAIWLPTQPTGEPHTYTCPDLQLLDDREESSNEH